MYVLFLFKFYYFIFIFKILYCNLLIFLLPSCPYRQVHFQEKGNKKLTKFYNLSYCYLFPILCRKPGTHILPYLLIWLQGAERGYYVLIVPNEQFTLFCLALYAGMTTTQTLSPEIPCLSDFGWSPLMKEIREGKSQGYYTALFLLWAVVTSLHSNRFHWVAFHAQSQLSFRLWYYYLLLFPIKLRHTTSSTVAKLCMPQPLLAGSFNLVCSL